MSGEFDNLVLVYLRRLDEKIDRLIDDVQDLKHRVTSLEGQMASIRTDMAAMSLRIDRIDTRLDRIEWRLDLVAQSPAWQAVKELLNAKSGPILPSSSRRRPGSISPPLRIFLANISLSRATTARAAERWTPASAGVTN